MQVVEPRYPPYLFQDVTPPEVTMGSVYYNCQSTPDRKTVRDGATDLRGVHPTIRRGGVVDC